MSELPPGALAKATAMIKGFEGLRLAPYRDGGGVWTIGWGNTYLADGERVTRATPVLTEEGAEELLTVVVAATGRSVVEMVHVEATDDQLAALTSLAYDIGTGRLRGSTLLRDFNQGNADEAAGQFGGFVYDHLGNIEPGLVMRRALERAVFLSTSQPAPVVEDADNSADDLNQAELDKLHGAQA